MAWQDDPIIDGAPFFNPMGAPIPPNFGQRFLPQEAPWSSAAPAREPLWQDFREDSNHPKLQPIVGIIARMLTPDSVVRKYKGIAQSLIQNLSNNAFSQDELDRMSDQIYRNIPEGDLIPFGGIDPNQTPLSLDKTQYEIIRNQLNRLTPDLRGKAVQQLDSAIQSGSLRCASCGSPFR